MTKFLVKVEKVAGHCTRGYREGDEFIFNGFDTPDAFCGSSYTVLFPTLTALRSGGRFTDENNPRGRTRWMTSAAPRAPPASYRTRKSGLRHR